MEKIGKQSNRMSRRDFLRLASLTAAGGILSACIVSAPVQQAPPAEAPAAPPEAAEAAPPAPAGATVEMMMWGGELSDDEVKLFNENNPGITLARIDPDNTRYFAMLAAGNPPGVFRLQAPQFPQLLAREIPLNLQPFMDVGTTLKTEDLTSANNYYRSTGGAMEIGDGAVYGMVKDWSPDLTVWANLDLIEEAGLAAPSFTEPLSYEEIRAYAEKLAKFEGDRTVNRGFDFDRGWVERYWMVWLEGIGSSLFTADFTKIDLVNNPEAREAIEYHFKLGEDKLSVTAFNPSPAWIGQDFADGTLGLVQYGFWFSGGLELWASDAMKEKRDAGRIVLLPSPTWKGVRRGPTITATGAIVTAASSAPEAAYRVFEWYMGEEPADGRARSGWGLPALKSKFDMIPKESVFRAQVWSVVEAELDYAVFIAKFNPFLAGGEPGEVGSLFDQFQEQALAGDMTFDEMIERMETDTNVAIQEGIERIA